MKAGLLGRTLGHSLSPQIHRFFGDYEYRLYEKEPEEVAGFLRNGFANGDFDFLNVTIPYKQTVFELCDELSPMARKLGNVNFVTRTADGKLRGDNTDAFGVGRLLEANGIDVRGWNCAILGAGGAAMTVKAVLEERGAKRVTFVRRGEEPAQDDDLVVNATPVGMWPHADEVRVDILQYVASKAVLDLVYNPSPTRLVCEARACGKIAADGMVMLIAQAWRAFQIANCKSQISNPKSQNSNRIAQSSDSKFPDSKLFLYGPPASGKSTWAKRIAAATGWTLVDLDAEIVKTAGRSIPEIFEKDGEKGFREIEKRCLAAVCGDRNVATPTRSTGRVIALGGGALLDPESRKIAETAGRVVVLDCPIETLKARLTGGDRPLSADTAKLEALVKSRAAHYASFTRQVKMI